MYELGGDIMESEEFQSSYNEVHHKATSVGNHSEEVACECLRINKFLKHFHLKNFSDQINEKQFEKQMVQVALCHDLGMLDRVDKYSSDKECHRLHPQESLLVAKKLIPDMSIDMEDAILNHMWPVTPKKPQSKMGNIITVADKICAARDLRHIARKQGLALAAAVVFIFMPKI